jgi:hypothetical protein
LDVYEAAFIPAGPNRLHIISRKDRRPAIVSFNGLENVAYSEPLSEDKGIPERPSPETTSHLKPGGRGRENISHGYTEGLKIDRFGNVADNIQVLTSLFILRFVRPGNDDDWKFRQLRS